MPRLTKLSRYADAVQTTTKVLPVLARLIGQFLGTDMPYNPGDTFVRRGKWNDMRSVPCINCKHEYWESRNFIGVMYNVYNVLAVTPCQLKMYCTHTYFIYYQRRYFVQAATLPRIEEIFVMTFKDYKPGWGPIVTARFKKTDCGDAIVFNKFDLSIAKPLPRYSVVRYDMELRKLIACISRSRVAVV